MIWVDQSNDCIVKGCLVIGRFGEEMSVKVDHTEVTTKFAGGARERGRLVSGDAVRERAKTRPEYFVSEE